MPELPEVLTIIKDLNKEIKGKTFVKFIKEQNYKPNLDLSSIRNKKVINIYNIGKLIVFDISNKTPLYLTIHLNMSGILLFNTQDKFVKIAFELNDGNKLYFSDTRKFGIVRIMTDKDILMYAKKVGPSILDIHKHSKETSEKINQARKSIKDALLNQNLISGVGNIYANEALFISKVNPNTNSGALEIKKIQNILNNALAMINEGIAHRGSTIDRYRDIYNKTGTHQHYFRVYGKKDAPCPTCSATITFTKISGRGTYFCNECQK